MALKVKQIDLKRKFRKEIQELRYAIWGKCFECSGFQADGYFDCAVTDCLLYPHRLRQPLGRTPKGLASFLRGLKAKIQRKNSGE